MPILFFMDFEDLSNSKFGRLTVLMRVQNDAHNKAQYICECDCGGYVITVGATLKKGGTKSCGCIRKERGNRLTHGQTKIKSSEYNSWRGMKDRCWRKNNDSYKNYGGKGIVICERWRKFENFLEDMGPKPTPLHSLDRFPDKKGNYEPSNCRWATDDQQAKNKTDNYVLEYERVVYIFCDLARHLQIPQHELKRRIKNNEIEVKEIQPPRSRKKKK